MSIEVPHSQLEEAVMKFLEEDVAAFTEELASIEAEVKDHETPYSKEHLVRVTEAATHCLRTCRELECEIGDQEQELRAAQKAFRNAIAPWFDKSWFMERGKTKPKGYPGDYIMLSAIYERLPKSPGLGGYLDQYILASALGRAVPGRMRAVKQFLVEELARRDGEVSILDIACGPCREFVDGLEHGPNVHPKITVVDSDQETLDFVAHSVSGVNGAPELNCVRHNALKIKSAKRNVERFGRPNIIYSVGLFDYIPDRLLIPMLQGLRETLADDGVLYLAFKDADRYDKSPYQWMQDWFFFQRTVDDCLDLYRQAGFDVDKMEMTRDDTGVIVNFISRVPTDSRYRVDRAQQVSSPQADVQEPNALLRPR